MHPELQSSFFRGGLLAMAAAAGAFGRVAHSAADTQRQFVRAVDDLAGRKTVSWPRFDSPKARTARGRKQRKVQAMRDLQAWDRHWRGPRRVAVKRIGGNGTYIDASSLGSFDARLVFDDTDGYGVPE